jgi:hypothetical protein
MDAGNRDRKREWKQQQRLAAREAFPIPDSMLESLFDSVNEKVKEEGCDHSLRFTKEWLAANEQSVENVVAWLNEHGGYCDCEVVANAADHWEQYR